MLTKTNFKECNLFVYYLIKTSRPIRSFYASKINGYNAFPEYYVLH